MKNQYTKWYLISLLVMWGLSWGVWAIFDIDEAVFIVYACVYVMIGYMVMAVTKMMNRKKKGENYGEEN